MRSRKRGSLIISNIAKDMKKQELSFTIAGCLNWFNTLENILTYLAENGDIYRQIRCACF